MMKLSDLIADLKRDEGVKMKPYTDTVGKLTIGVGRNLDDRGITEAEAEHLLVNDIAVAQDDLDRNVSYWREWPDNVQRAVANMCFQMGWTKLKYFTNMWAALEADDWEAAAAEALDSLWARQTPERARRVADMMRLG